MSRMLSLEYCSSSLIEIYASRTLRLIEMSSISEERIVLRTNCCVMVDAPSRSPPMRLFTKARPMPPPSFAPWGKRSSSVATVPQAHVQLNLADFDRVAVLQLEFREHRLAVARVHDRRLRGVVRVGALIIRRSVRFTVSTDQTPQQSETTNTKITATTAITAVDGCFFLILALLLIARDATGTSSLVKMTLASARFPLESSPFCQQMGTGRL